MLGALRFVLTWATVGILVTGILLFIGVLSGWV